MKWFLVILTFVLVLFSSCVEENITTDPRFCLTFSCDTLVFDTLFSGQPSATKTFMMYNENKKALRVDEICLGGGDDSPFRFNVDGRIASSGESLKDIVIKGRDSLYVLIEATISDFESDSLLSLAFDSLTFSVNGNTQDVKLIAVGRDIHFIKNLSISENTTLRADKPYLVFGYLHVPENLALTLAEGVQIYMHQGSNIIVDGSISIEGSFEQPVSIRGDRMDAINDVDQTPYSQLPNQWGGIFLQNPAQRYTIRNAVIRGMSSGVMLIGSNRVSPSLTIANSVIHNSGMYGVYAQMADLTIENSEISNCGTSCLSVIGGNTYMAHSTIANYYRFASRSTASLRVLNSVYKNGFAQVYPVSSFVVENSIVFGQNYTEIEMICDTTAVFNLFVSNSLIKSKQLELPYFQNCLWARSCNYKNAVDTVFKCVSVANIDRTGYYDFSLDSLSFARNSASQTIAVRYPYDLVNYSRFFDGKPDLGAYEFHSKQ